MTDTVLVSTHRLALAGALREAFRREGLRVDLVSDPGDALRSEGAVLLVLTGEGGAGEVEVWKTRVQDQLDVPLFTVFQGGDALRRGRELGALEAFPPGATADEVALVGRRTVARRRLQSLTGIVGDSEALRELLERVIQMAPVDSTVLLTGESGTGKELVARGIHALSPRKHRAFLAVNVAALSDTLLESELFGHEKGAFTGAVDSRKGFFELAHRGTLFLDEIGEMPLVTQTKFLRVLEQREFMRVGGETPIQVDVRIVAATNRDLREAVERGEFRRDLYYRLNILDLRLPALRERRADIPVLIRHFVREVSERVERPFHGITLEALEVLERHDWPGNVRELRNLVESMVVLSPGREVRPEDLPLEIRSPRTGLPAPWRGGVGGVESLPVHSDTGRGEAGAVLRPELEFIFRTLVELRVDMEELRREFERYRLGADALPPERRTPQGENPWGGRTEVEVVRRPLSEGEIELHTLEEVPPEEPFQLPEGMTMEALEEAAIRAALDEARGNRRVAAERLGIGERTLYRKIQRYALDG